MSATSRPLLVGALTAAVIALVSSAAVAVGAVGGHSRSARFSVRLPACGPEASRNSCECLSDKHGWTNDGRPR
jgi:hypothetical protein